jgi:hypothetical protein
VNAVCTFRHAEFHTVFSSSLTAAVNKLYITADGVGCGKELLMEWAVSKTVFNFKSTTGWYLLGNGYSWVFCKEVLSYLSNIFDFKQLLIF